MSDDPYFPLYEPRTVYTRGPNPETQTAKVVTGPGPAPTPDFMRELRQQDSRGVDFEARLLDEILANLQETVVNAGQSGNEPYKSLLDDAQKVRRAIADAEKDLERRIRDVRFAHRYPRLMSLDDATRAASEALQRIQDLFNRTWRWLGRLPAPQDIPRAGPPTRPSPASRGSGPTSSLANQLSGLGRQLGFGPGMPGRAGGTGVRPGRAGGRGPSGGGASMSAGPNPSSEMKNDYAFGPGGGFGTVGPEGWGPIADAIGAALSALGKALSGAFSPQEKPLPDTRGSSEELKLGAVGGKVPAPDPEQPGQAPAPDPERPADQGPQLGETPAPGEYTDENGNWVYVAGDGSMTVQNDDGSSTTFHPDGTSETSGGNGGGGGETPDPEGGDSESAPSSFYFHAFHPRGGGVAEDAFGDAESAVGFEDFLQGRAGALPDLARAHVSGPSNDRGGTNPRFFGFFPDPESSGGSNPRARSYFPNPEDAGGGSPRSVVYSTSSRLRTRGPAKLLAQIEAALGRTSAADRRLAYKPNPEDTGGPHGPSARLQSPSIGARLGPRTGQLS